MSAKHLFYSMQIIKYAVDSVVGYNGAGFNSVCCKYSQFLEKNCYPVWIRVSIINPRTQKQIHTRTVVQGEVGVDGIPPRSVVYVAVFRNDYRLQWKAFNLRKMRYIRWAVALLEAYDFTNNGCHLGFYQEFEVRFKPREMVIFFALNMINNT